MPNSNTTQQDTALDLHGVNAGYNGHQVLFDVEFRVQRGSIFGVLGPNGSGKTTLMKVISRTLPSSSGHVFMNGADASSLSQRELARTLAVVPQVTHVEFNFTAYEMVGMGRTPYQKRLEYEGREDRRIIRQSMDSTDCWHLRDRLFKELSGGESQRVILARCLAQRCKLLLLDEPTAHLDIKYQAEIFLLLRRLRDEKNITILINTHDLNQASYFCDEILLLKKGRCMTQGAPRDVITTENVEKVFDTRARITTDPDTGLPLVSPEF